MNKLIVCATVLSIALTGCQNIQTAAANAKQSIKNGYVAFEKMAAKGSYDRYMQIPESLRKQFFYVENEATEFPAVKLSNQLSQAKFELSSYDAGAIFISKYIQDASQPEVKWTRDYVRSGKYGSERDLVSQMFIQQAKAQGHEVRVFKAYFAGEVNKRLSQDIVPAQNVELIYDAEPMMIQYDQTGRPIAVMTRSWRISTIIGIHAYIYSNIYYGSDVINMIENDYSNRKFEDALLRKYN